MAMVFSHSNREIIKLVLTAPRDCHTKLVCMGGIWIQTAYVWPGYAQHQQAKV